MNWKTLLAKRANSKSDFWADISSENRLLIKRVLIIGWFVTLLILVCSFLVFILEHGPKGSNTVNSFWDGIWWAVVTIATVGYGDKYPVTIPGRIVGLVLIVFGFVMLSVFTGLIASVFVEDKLKGAKGLKPIHASHHMVVCGWNQTAFIMLQALMEKSIGNLIIGIVASQTGEFFESLESQFPSLQLRFVRGEPTQEEILRRASVQSANQVLILADPNLSAQSADERSIIIANAVHFISRKVLVTVQLMNSSNKTMLQRIGIESIIVYDEIGGYLLANTVLEQRFLEIYEKLAKDHAQKIVTVKIPDNFINRTYGEVFDHFYNEEKMLLVGIFTKEPDLDINDIFSDNASAIDQFIKAALAKSRKTQPEKRTSVNWNPDRSTLIQNNDLAIVMC